MTPQERKLLDELFDRLASLENGQRDPDAVRAINEGLQRAPNALYPLVQTALVQDEALKRADARIRELENELDLEPGEPVQQQGFLDNMRDALVGKRDSHGSVPSVRPGAAPAQASPWGNTGAQNMGVQQPGYAPQAPGYGGSPGGSFLGTAAASAAGVVGGALLMNSFRSMFGGAHASPSSAFESGGSGSPWNAPASDSQAARDAGINDIGNGNRTAAFDDDSSQRAGLFDTAQNDDSYDDDDDSDDDDSDFGDDGGSDDGGSDTA